MNLHSMEIPEERAELVAWLERHAVGLELAELVAELSAVSADETRVASTLDEILGEDLSSVLDTGLSRIPSDRLRALLRQPRLLLDLQERILVEGGEYWQQQSSHRDNVGDLAERGWRSLNASLSLSASVSGPRRPQTRQVRSWDRPWIVSLATAACVLLAVSLWSHFSRDGVESVASDWGWNRPEALPQDLPADVYFQQLADGANEWFKKRPETAEELAKRIGQFRQGCSTIILADHQSIPESDRKWLIGKCRDWAAKLDQHLAAAEAEDPDVLQIRDQADETIRRLIEALRSRAEGVG